MAFLLTYLGTDTQYTPHGYLGASRGETLSYIKSRIRTPNVEVNDEDSVIVSAEASSPEDSILFNPTERLHNGPDTFGYRLYEIMAKGVSDALRTIAHGEQMINIIGHSRGAIESIIASHELERIQNAFQDATIHSADDLFKLLCNSEHEQTKLYLKQYLEPHKERLFENLQILKNNMVDVKVNLFLLDPVPGGSVLGAALGKISDGRYYNIPAIVSTCREILLENERSRGFKAIVPRVTAPEKTTFSLINLPGHHGTASGNPYDQRVTRTNTDTEYSELKTKEVQDITLYELYDFLSKHGVEFDDGVGQDDNDLHALFLTYHCSSDQQKSKIKLNAYNTILENKAAYMAFNQTCYSTGQEGSVQSALTLGYYPQHDRLIHVGGPGDTSLKSIVSFQSDTFVNAVHARLYLRDQLNLDQTQTPVESLEAILSSFDENMKSIHEIFEGDTDGSLTLAIKNSLQMMFSGVVQTYLRNNLPEDEKARILSVIERVINIEIDDESSLSAFVRDLKLDLVTKLSNDMHALTASHQFDVLNLLGRDEQDIRNIDSKIEQLGLFKTHVEVVQAYFSRFESVQAQLADNQSILDECLSHLATRRHAITRDRERYEMTKEELISVQVELMEAIKKFEEELRVQVEGNSILNVEKKQLQGENSRIQEDNAQLRTDNIQLREENTQVIALAEFLQKDNARLQGKNALLEADKVLIQKENTRIQQELEASNVELTSNKQRIVDLEVDLAAQKEANRVLFAEKTTAEVERDALRTDLQDSNAQIDDKSQRITDLEEILESPDSDVLFQGLSLEILGGFALVLGVAVVALALTALMLTPMAPLVPIGITLAGAGLARAGFFGMRQGILQQQQEALHKRTLEVHV